MIDVLAELADPELVAWWTPERQVTLEREFWVKVMRIQKELGVAIPSEAIQRSTLSIYPDDPHATLARIAQREQRVRHDLKARLEIFCDDAGHEFHHLGLTSADVVDNVMQVRIMRSLHHLSRTMDLAGFLRRYQMRGVAGPVGTAQDQLELLGSPEAVDKLNQSLAIHYGFGGGTMGSVGQVYPRSQDLDIAGAVTVAVLLARSDRGIRNGWGYTAALAGYQSMIASYSGDQWNEGDVSTSVLRRVALPGLIFSADLAVRP